MQAKGVEEGGQPFHQAEDADGQEGPKCEDGEEDDGPEPVGRVSLWYLCLAWLL